MTIQDRVFYPLNNSNSQLVSTAGLCINSAPFGRRTQRFEEITHGSEEITGQIIIFSQLRKCSLSTVLEGIIQITGQLIQVRSTSQATSY